MSKIAIELVHQRIPRPPFVPSEGGSTEPSTGHNGKISMQNIEANCGLFEAVFENKELEDVAIWLHHLVRFASLVGYEFSVAITQKPPRGGRSVTNQLNLTQVELIYRSEESARAFLSPTTINRGE
ncbi:MAG: hypothetical protein KAY24_19925 [Candidatus Eisenbacteria sp.]|nr:hypothetical protein [Candidatus Eisenbacteria bacterium]